MYNIYKFIIHEYDNNRNRTCNNRNKKEGGFFNTHPSSTNTMFHGYDYQRIPK